jgi:tungstate transport system ATP-binding protein
VKEVIRALNIVKYFGETRILDNVSLEAHRGRIAVIMGPNGSGKSTLLKILALLIPPDDGRLEIDDSPIDFDNELEKRSLQKKIAYLPQRPPVLSASVFNNIYLPLRLRGASKEEAKKTTENILSMLRLKEYAKINAQRLSGGQKQLLAIARALALNPEILLFDEPTASLSPNTAETVQNILRRYVREKSCYAVIVSHSITEAKKIADDLYLLVSGKIKEKFSGKIPETDILKWI